MNSFYLVCISLNVEDLNLGAELLMYVNIALLSIKNYSIRCPIKLFTKIYILIISESKYFTARF